MRSTRRRSSAPRSYTAEGVSCEACHGPASGWLGPHTTRGWTHAQSVAARHVRHQRSREPHRKVRVVPHRRRREVRRSRDDRRRPSRSGVRSRSVQRGDAAALAERGSVAERPLVECRSNRSAARRPRAAVDAFQRRRLAGVRRARLFLVSSLVDAPGKQLAAGAGLSRSTAGNPPWNHARFAVARHVARVADPGSADALESQIQNLAGEVSKLQADRARIASATVAVQGSLDALARRLVCRAVDRARTFQYVRAIAEDADRIAAAGERAAEQAAMSLETLLGTLAQNKEVDQAASRAALDRCFSSWRTLRDTTREGSRPCCAGSRICFAEWQP